jgi:flagellar M-ring protein FliF
VLVPAADVDQLRLKVASEGMPRTGNPGWELFDKVAFGVTDRVEEINHQRALEGELSRTLSTIREVAGAKVHLALPKASVFVSETRDEPTAAVTLKLRQNLKLEPSTIRAITALVSASVPGLRPEKVVVIDDFGRPLATPSEDEDGASGPPLERQQAIERELELKTVEMLEPIVGPGHVRVNVTARLSTATEERTAEAIDPNVIAVRSEQTVMQATGGGPGVAGGVAGARTNLPTPPAAPPAAGAAPAPPAAPPTLVPGASQSQSVNRTYEMNKTVTHTVQPQGQIARLSVAVLVDDTHVPPPAGTTGPVKMTPRTPEQMTKLRDLVEKSVGFDPMRGDVLTVENVAFEQPPVEPEVVLPIWQRYQEQGFEALRILAVLVIALLAFFMVIRPAMRRAFPAPIPAPAAIGAATAAPPRTVQEMEDDLEAEINAQLEAVAGHAASKRLPVLTKRATAFTDKEPENAARLVRAWLTEEER